MHRAILAFLAAAAAFVPSSSQAGPDDAEARARFKKGMDAVYDYLPYDVTQAVRDAKVPKMAAFWKFVNGDLETYRPLLREALRDEKANRYFLYDGAGLLVDKSKDPADLQLAADATARCRLKDVGRGYFYFCHTLMRQGADAVPAVLQMLGDKDYSVDVPKHSLRLSQSDCVRLCLLLQDEARWVAPLVKRLATEKDPVAFATIARCLSDAETPEATEALDVTSKDEHLERSLRDVAGEALFKCTVVTKLWPGARAGKSREAFEGWLFGADAAGRLPKDAMTDGSREDARILVRAADRPVLRSLRRKTAVRISDEALGEIDLLTELLHRAN
jgi:hypothetical protein